MVYTSFVAFVLVQISVLRMQPGNLNNMYRLPGVIHCTNVIAFAKTILCCLYQPVVLRVVTHLTSNHVYQVDSDRQNIIWSWTDIATHRSTVRQYNNNSLVHHYISMQPRYTTLLDIRIHRHHNHFSLKQENTLQDKMQRRTYLYFNSKFR